MSLVVSRVYPVRHLTKAPVEFTGKQGCTIHSVQIAADFKYPIPAKYKYLGNPLPRKRYSNALSTSFAVGAVTVLVNMSPTRDRSVLHSQRDGLEFWRLKHPSLELTDNFPCLPPVYGNNSIR